MNTKIKKDKKKARQSKDGTMSFIDHLDELRRRLIRYFIVLIVFVLATYFFREDILNLVKKPVDIPLEKYTAVSTVNPNQRQTSGMDLAQYNCVCRQVIPFTQTNTASESQSSDPATMKGNGSDSPAKDKGKKVGNIITSTVDDFVMFFQSLLGKNPSPIFGEAPVLEQAPASQVITVSLDSDDVINLDCECSLKTPDSKQGASMVYIGLPELFFTQMKVAIFAGIFLSLPYLMIELWGFVGPALYSGEKKIFWVFAIGSYFFFVGGALFGYFVVFPFGFDFFLSLTQMGEIMPSLSIGAYLSFAIKLLIAFGAIFELPLVVFILSRMGILTPRVMIKQARIAIFVIFVAAAMLTPPDPFTMVLMAGPLILLYAFSVLVCFFGLNRQKAALRAQGIDMDDDDDDDDEA